MTDLLTVASINKVEKYLASNGICLHTALRDVCVDSDCSELLSLCATARVGARAVAIVKEEREEWNSEYLSEQRGTPARSFNKGGVEACDEILRRLTATTETWEGK